MIQSIFTIASTNFLGRALTLWDSVREHHPQSHFTIYLVDEVDITPLGLPPEVTVVNARDIQIPQFEKMTNKYNITELNTAVKPFAFLHQFQVLSVKNSLYLDPDTYLYSSLEEVDSSFESGINLVLTPHLTRPDVRGVTHNQTFLKYGVYNLGFIGVRNTDETLMAMEWWGNMLLEHCVIDLEAGLFVDQKWADLLPSFVEHTKIIRHSGYNVAYWNLHERILQAGISKLMSNEEPLRFLHFSGLEKEKETISRHATQLPTHRDRLFLQLKGDYISRINSNRDEEFGQLPYSYSWNGEKRINLHTPKPGGNSGNGNAPIPSNSQLRNRAVFGNAWSLIGAARFFLGYKSGRFTLAKNFGAALVRGDFDKIRTAFANIASHPNSLEGPSRDREPDKESTQKNSGRSLLAIIRSLGALAVFFLNYREGRFMLVMKFTRALFAGDFKTIALAFKTFSSFKHKAQTKAEKRFQSFSAERLLFIDWAVPSPNKDAGSLFQYQLMSILVGMGKEVYFIPANLLPDEDLVLEGAGVKVVSYPELDSVSNWLEENVRFFGQVWMSRGPVSHPFLAVVKKLAPFTKVVFNTLDLHFLREDRAKSFDQLSSEKNNGLSETREMEYELISKSDLTLVVSEYELNLLQEKFPDSNFFHLPLIYDDRPYTEVGFGKREDILFIGSFNHAPNWDGLKWFLSSILPLVRESIPELRINVVGQNPPQELIKLAETDRNIVVHGFVEDVVKIFEGVRLSVAPLRFGAGSKGKVAQSLSLGVPVISTSIGAEGMKIEAGAEVSVTDDPSEFARELVRIYLDEVAWSRMSVIGWRKFQAEFSVSAAIGKVSNLLQVIDQSRLNDTAYVNLDHFHSRMEQLGKALPLFERRYEIEMLLAVPGAIDFKIKGYCSFCKRPSVFLSSYMYAGSTYPNGNLEPNWREHLQCESCKLVTRLRFVFHVLDREFSYSSSSRVYVSERLTEFYSRLESIFPSIIGSEYLSESATPGELYEGIRHENIESLSFDSGMFDLVISCDVLEHVLDYKAAIASIFDVLDEGGTALFTAPFDFDSMDHETRAVITNGSRVDLMEPEYHGNPVDPEGGSFCWRYYGWVLLEELKACGFKDVSLFAGWSPEFAYLGRPQIVIAATK